jgi:hypothetical protein
MYPQPAQQQRKKQNKTLSHNDKNIRHTMTKMNLNLPPKYMMKQTEGKNM